MYHVTCRFEFPDGAVAEWKASAVGPEDEVPLAVSGASERVHYQPTIGIVSIPCVAKAVAARAGAKLTISTSGQYDTWAI